jgi:hypothetical protein
MRSSISLPALSLLTLAVLTLAAFPANADELTFTLDSYTGFGLPTSLNPDPDTCRPPNCVLFTGTLTDSDIDGTPDLNPSYLLISVPYTGDAPFTDSADQFNFAGILLLDNLAPPGLFSGDTDYATDGLLNPPNTFTGAVFGVDIPSGTPLGVYQDTVRLDVTPTNGNNPFTVSAVVTVVVAPEPAPAGLLLGGLAVLAVGYGVKRKWRSSETLR